MGPYVKKFDRAADVWHVYGNSASEGEEPVLDDLLATLQTESLAQCLLYNLTRYGAEDDWQAARYVKLHNPVLDTWYLFAEVEERSGRDLVAEVRTEGLVDLLLACMKKGLSADDIESLPNCFSTTTGAQMRADLFDAQGVQVSALMGNARTVALECFEFIYLHGGDPDEEGKGAQAGNLEFGPPDPREEVPSA